MASVDLVHPGASPFPGLRGEPLARSYPAAGNGKCVPRPIRESLLCSQAELERQCDLYDVPGLRQKLQIVILATKRKLPLNLIIIL